MKQALWFVGILALVGLVLVGGIFIYQKISSDQVYIVGNDIDEHGCKPSTGYTWCPSTGQCQRMWEEYCEEYKDQYREVESFADCVELGLPVMESYPRQCSYRGQMFVEDVGNVLEKLDKIVLETPLPSSFIDSPLTIKGQARGTWFFEASFPVVLVNWDGLIIAEGFATAESDWMTEDFVPFTASLNFTPDTTVSNRGALILQRDNPSGLPENDDALEIPVFFN